MPYGANAAERQAGRLRRLVPLAVLVSVGTIVAVSVWHQVRGGEDLLASLRAFDLALVPALVGLHLLMQLWWSLRLRVLSAGLGFPLRQATAQGVVTSGLFAAAVTPGRVGGEPWRIALLVRRGASGAQASRIVLADRAADVVFFLLSGLIVVVALPRLFGAEGAQVQAIALVALLGLLGIAALLALALARPRLLARGLGRFAAGWDRVRRRARQERGARIEAFLAEVRTGMGALVRTGKRRLAVALLLGVLLWTTEFGVLWLALRGFGHDVPFLAVYAAGVLLTMVASVPLLPGGSGVAEVTALAVLSAVAPGLSPAFLIVWRGSTYYLDLALGGLVAAAMVRRPAARKDTAPRDASGAGPALGSARARADVDPEPAQGGS